MHSKFIRALYSEWGSGVTGTLSAPLFVAAFLTNGVPRLLCAVFATVCLYVAAYLVWAKERERALSLAARIEALEFPPDRPKLSFVKWGPIEPKYLEGDSHPALAMQTGFSLANDGGTALEVKVADFVVGNIQAQSKVVPRIEANATGFAAVWLASPTPVFKWTLDQQLMQAAEDAINTRKVPYGGEYRIPLRVTYRDFGNVDYASEAELIFHHHLSRMEFSATTQSTLGLRIQGK
jgi:hypothetical protein